MKKIILASTSPRRRDLLEQAGLSFDILVTQCNEECGKDTPSEYVEELSFRKCKAGADLLIETCEKNSIVIGADTVVVYNNSILEKPESKEAAFKMLKSLSGKEHHVYTGVTIIDCATGKTYTFHECTSVKFYEVSDAEIQNYVDDGEPMDKAGAYGIQGKGVFLVEKINGDYNNVVGLPVARLLRVLKSSGYIK